LEKTLEKQKQEAPPAPAAQPVEETKPVAFTAPVNSTIQSAVQVSSPAGTESKKEPVDTLAVAKAVQATLAKNALQLAEAKALATAKESERLHQEEI